MNQYRCETCKFYDNRGIDGFGIWCKPMQVPEAHWFRRHDLNGMEMENITKIIGCASHSDFQSDREKVLDEFKNWIIHDLVFCDSIGADHMFSHELILDKIDKLRQKAGE